MKYLTLAAAVAAALCPQISLADEKNTDLVFSGYSRFGMHMADNGNDYVTADGQLNGNAAGRLGNESYGAELQFSKGFIGENDTQWDLVFMLDSWWKNSGDYSDVELKKIYAGVSNVFASQPDAYIWAGRDFHQRPAQELNDYMFMSHDGQGAGVKNIDLGNARLELGFVGKVASEGTGESGDYAVTSKLHQIALGDSVSLALFANYGFSTEKTTDPELDTYQLASQFSFDSGEKLVARYSKNSDNSSFNKTDGLTTTYLSYDGDIKFSDSSIMLFNLAYHTLDAKDNELDRVNYSAIIRPTYFWNDKYSTWLEAGYSNVDYDNAGENDAWKMTLSQNISIGKGIFERPMLRFYATVGESTNEVDSTGLANSTVLVRDTVALGAMFEAWW
jgi:maltoporin